MYELLDNLFTWCHERWIEVMECGDAPQRTCHWARGRPMLMKSVIQEAIEQVKKKKKKKSK